MATNVGTVEVGIDVHARKAISQLQQTHKQFLNVGQSANATNGQIVQLRKTLLAVGTAVGAVGYGMVQLGRKSFKAAADVSEMNVAMGAVNKSLGLAPGAISNTAKEVRSMGIEMKSAQEIALIFAQGQLDMSKASKVARVAQDLAVLSQSNSTETARTLAYAIQSGNSQLLKSAGITRYAGEAYAEYAAKLGKSEAALTATERQTAVTNMILEEGAKVAGTYTAAMMEPGKVLRSFPRLLNDMQIEFGNVLKEGFGPAIKASYDLTKQISKLFTEGGRLHPVLKSIGYAFGDMMEPLTQFLKDAKSSVKEFNKYGMSVSTLGDKFKNLAPLIGSAGTAVSLFAGKQILSGIPVLGKYASLLGGPLTSGLAFFIASNENARKAAMNLVQAVAPAFTTLAVTMVKLVEAITPIVNGFAQLAAFLTSLPGGAEALAIAIGAVVAKKILLNAQNTALMSGFSKLKAGFVEQIAYQKKLAVMSGTSASQMQIFGAAVTSSLRGAAIAMKSFMMSALPLIALTAGIFAVTKVVGHFTERAKRAKERQELLIQSMKDAGDPVATLTDDVRELADAFESLSTGAKKGEEGVEEFVGQAMVMATAAEYEASGALNKLNMTAEDLFDVMSDGNDVFDELTNRHLTLEQQIAGLQEIMDTTANSEVRNLAAQLMVLAQSGDVTSDDMAKLLGTVDEVGNTVRGATKSIEEQNLAYIKSKEFIEDYTKMLGEDYVNGVIAAVDEVDELGNKVNTATEVLEEHHKFAKLVASEYQRDAQMARNYAAAVREIPPPTQETIDYQSQLAEALFIAGDAAGDTMFQIRDLAYALEGLDALDPKIIVDIGMNVLGGPQLLKMIDDLIALEGLGGFETALPEFGVGGRIGQLMEYRAALEDMLNAPSGGRGGGGSAVDEVEQLQQAIDALSYTIADIGKGLTGRDFAEQLMGASPEELTGIFEGVTEQLVDMANQMEALGQDGSQVTQIIQGLADQFEELAEASRRAAELTEELVDAQDELAKRTGFYEDLAADYRKFRDAYNLSPTTREKKDPLEVALYQLDNGIGKLRDAQRELDSILTQRSDFQRSITEAFTPQLEPNVNVMAQTQRILGQARTFRDNLIALRDKGFPADVIRQVVGLGLSGGAQLSSQLLKMSGGQMDEFLRMRAEIGRLGAETAEIAANVVFGADVANAQGEVDRLVSVVDNLYANAVAEAKKQMDEQRNIVEDLTESLDTATEQMAELVNSIQMNLFNAFNNFLANIGGAVTALTTTPVSLSVTPTETFTEIINALKAAGIDVGSGTITPAPAPVAPPTPTNPPAPIIPEKTITVNSGDGGFRLLKRIGVDQTGANMKKLWEHNGLWYDSWKTGKHQTVYGGNVLRIPAFAMGGYVKAGQLSLVGEKGPELFAPNTGGTVIPNHALGGKGDTYNITINTHSGMRAEDIVKEIERYTRRRGNLAIPTTSARRR